MIIKKEDVTPERPVIIVISGVPGSGKTSVATTAVHPILIDTDRGFDRAVQRVDTLAAKEWSDIISDIDTICKYKTIIVDTAKAMLDDYLSDFVCQSNYKLKTNALKRYAAMADEFKAFVNKLRAANADIIFICHDKETQEGDVIKHAPDCTGQSKDLLLRIADQVGFISIRNKERVIDFTSSDNYVTKNVAQLQPMRIPDISSQEFPTLMAMIIDQVKTAIHSKSEAQRIAQQLLSTLRTTLAQVDTIEDIDSLLKESSALPPMLKAPFFAEVKETLATRGFIYDNKAKKFIRNEKTDSQGNPT